MSRFPTVKNTSQSSSYNSDTTSVKVVDGCTKQRYSDGCCSHTAADKKEAWLQIDLQGPVVMDHVNIYYRNDSDIQRKRFGGYQLYQSNTSEWRDGYLCFQDKTLTMEELSFTPVIPCTGSARYLTIYSNRRSKAWRLLWYSEEAFLELCEVEVYGCPLGKFGDGNCDSECDAGCANGLCDPKTGECEYCAERYYRVGSSCIACPSNCYDGLCNVETGDCVECNSGYHGNQCDKKCPPHCKDNVCNKTNGQCIGCGADYYGKNCSSRCPDNCKDHNCMQENGECIVVVVSLPNKEEDINVTAIGVGSGFGVAIVALIIVIIVLARRLRSGNNRDTTRSTTMTDIPLPSIGQDQQAENDGTYEIIDAQKRNEFATKQYPIDDKYERLGQRENEIPHIYEVM